MNTTCDLRDEKLRCRLWESQKRDLGNGQLCDFTDVSFRTTQADREFFPKTCNVERLGTLFHVMGIYRRNPTPLRIISGSRQHFCMRREQKDGDLSGQETPGTVVFGFTSGRPNLEVFTWEGISGFVNRSVATHFKVRAFDSPEGRYLYGGDKFDLFQPDDTPEGEKVAIHLPDKTEGLFKVELFKQTNLTGSPKLIRVPVKPTLGGPEYEVVVNFTGSSVIRPRELVPHNQSGANPHALLAPSNQAALAHVAHTEALTHAGLSQVLGVVLNALNSSYEVQNKQSRSMTEYVDRIESRLLQAENDLKKKDNSVQVSCWRTECVIL